MSKAIQYDSLLVRALTDALDRRYRDRPVRAIRLSASAIALVGSRRTLFWDLDPDGGFLVERRETGRPTGLMLPRGAKTSGVHARPDDRIVQWTISAPEAGAGTRELVLWIELLPRRRSAVLVAESRILASTGRAGSTGARYEPPASRTRSFASELPDRQSFMGAVGDIGADRERALLAGVAWTSPLNIPSILGTSPSGIVGSDAYERYLNLVRLDAAPGIIDPGGRCQPYPAPIAEPFERHADLLHAFEVAAEVSRRADAALDSAAIIAAIERRITSVAKRATSLEQELDGATRDATSLRRKAELLLAQPGRARRGMTAIELDDFAGGSIEVDLDPALDGAANANRLFDQARRRDRAARKLPALIDQARSTVRRLEELLERVRAGNASDDEIAPFVPVTSRPGRRPKPIAALPYRRYRTTSGLEVRVGRGARANDELTLRHSSPDDVWLHARDVAGAHVVVRWSQRDANPPSADLVEAAVLAALHSRARTSGVVAVDWTRRRYVRKPRGSPPGQVMIERAKTLFVEPDGGTERRMRIE